MRLHSTGMTCPMTCPKNLRNGPCGGVRANGHCEVIPAMRCVWVEAWERSADARYGRDIHNVVAPLNRRACKGPRPGSTTSPAPLRPPPAGWAVWLETKQNGARSA